MKQKNNKRQTKPTGKSGYIHSGNNTNGGLALIEYPKNKEELEDFILERFIQNLDKNKTNTYNLKEKPLRNKENDFDYTLVTHNGLEYLDLMEIVVNKGKGSFNDASYQRNYGEFTDSLVKNILKKSNKYSGVRFEKHLLVYPTDWRYRCGESIIALVSYYLTQIDHCFKSVYYFALDSNKVGEIKKLAPYNKSFFKDFDFLKIRNKSSVVFNLEKVAFNKDGSFDVPIGPNNLTP